MNFFRKKSKKETSYGLASPKLQVVLIIFTTAILFYLFSKPVLKFYPEDPFPAITVLTPKQMASFGKSSSPVMVGMYIRSFPEFVVIKKRFVVDMKIWFKFDPKLISLDRIGKFTFDKAKILSISEPSTKIEGDMLMAEYDARIDFQAPLNFINFPLDDHQINFALTNYSFLPSEVEFESSRKNFGISQEVEAYGWDFVGRSVKTGYHKGFIDPTEKSIRGFHPRAIFSLDCSRSGIRLIISMFLPLFFIFLIALFTFCMSSGISISVATVTGIIAHRFIMENMSPKTSYFMLSDYVFIFLLMVCSIIFIVNIFGDRIAGCYKNILAVCMHAAVLFMFTYFLFYSLWSCF